MPATIEYLNWRAEGVSGDLHFRKVLAGEVVEYETGQLLHSSSERVAPFCPVYDTCGGCQLQHWQIAPYQNWKKQLITKSLERQNIEPPPIIFHDAEGAGRRRVSLHARKIDDKVVVGFMAARSHEVIDIESCPVLTPALNTVFKTARELAQRLGNCDIAFTSTDTGIDANVRAERKLADGQLNKLTPLVHQLKLTRLTVNGHLIALEKMPQIMMGRATVEIPPSSFIQATSKGESILAELVNEAAGKAKMIADLFCGLGPFTLRLSERAKLFAADSDRLALLCLARAAKNTSGLKPVTTQHRDLMREPLVANELKEFDTVVLDPPRAGAEAQARQLAKSSVRRIISISCDPASFGRDAALLIKGGYKLKQLNAVDQFKWTSHIETVGLFTR